MTVAYHTYVDADDQISEAAALTLAPFSTTHAAIEDGTDVDMYTFDVAANRRFTFDIDGTSGLNSVVRLFSGTGAALAGNENGAATGEVLGTDSFLTFNFLKAGRYYLAVSASGNTAGNAATGGGDKLAATTGDYTLVVSDVTADDHAGNTLVAARNLDALSGSSSYSDFVGAVDTADYYLFTLDQLTKFTVGLSGLTADANVQILQDKNNNGKIDKTDTLATGANKSVANESLVMQLSAGTYFVRVLAVGDTTYSLALNAQATPEVAVTGNNVNIVDGDTKPFAGDFTYFGMAAIGGAAPTYTFTVGNAGSATLNTSALTAPTGYTIVEGLSAAIAAGASDTFTLRLDTDVIGTKAGIVSFVCDDDSEALFNFIISGIVTPVDDSGNTLAAARNLGALSGDSSYSDFVGAVDTADYYRFALDQLSKLTVGLSGLTADANVQIIQDKNNNGIVDKTDTLATGANKGLADESLVTQLSAGTYFVRVLAVGNTDYDLALNAQATPDITITGNSVNIVDGDTTPSTGDFTAFGTIYHNADAVSRTFTIRNDGSAPLVITGIVLPTGYTLVDDPADTLAAGASDTFTVQLDSSVIGGKSGQIVITTNDWNEGTFNFSVSGVVAMIPAEAVLLYNDTEIADGDLTAALADGTDFGSAEFGGATVSRTFTLRNDGEAALTVKSLKLPSGWQLVEGLSSTIAGGASDNFTIKLNVLTLGQLAGQVSFVTNDASESTYNFAVAGSVTSAPDGDNDWFDQNLFKSTIRQVARNRFADDVIDRIDIINILKTATADDGKVDATELTDLRTIVANYDDLNMAEYVYVLSNNVVNSNVANAKYQGASLGNLAVGSVTATLDKLVNKWFYGLDRAAAGSYIYRQTAGQLFVSGIDFTDINQGSLGDCYFLAALSGTAQLNPDAITDMFIDNGDGTYTVRFYNGSNARYVTVDTYLPTNGNGQLVFAEYGSLYTNANNELWVALAEKAYAQVNEEGWIGQSNANNYLGIEGGWPDVSTAHITGGSHNWYGVPPMQTVLDWMDAGLSIYIGTKSATTGSWVGGHAYVLTGYNADTQTFTLYNPWGVQHQTNVSWATLAANTNNFFTASV
jgi:uncharacterized membrane protein